MQQPHLSSPASYRWIICALLFMATTINYVDRAVLGVIAPELRSTIGWSDEQYGLINCAFMVAYAIGSLGAGWMMDTVGVRLGFTLSLTVWSFAAALCLSSLPATAHLMRGSCLPHIDCFPRKRIPEDPVRPSRDEASIESPVRKAR